jgi:hypothetical protein
MTVPQRSRRLQTLVLATLVAGAAPAVPWPAAAQTIQVVPLAGYRFNNDLFEAAMNRPLDVDGAPVVGGAVNVATGSGLWFEALFTRQQADVTAAGDTFGPPVRSRVVVDQWLAGGRQEVGGRGVVPFFSGLAGFTRYGADGDDEIRFTLGAGGGVNVPVQRRFGFRADSRVFATFLELGAHTRACGPRGCILAVHANIVWQFEFTGDVVVVF